MKMLSENQMNATRWPLLFIIALFTLTTGCDDSSSGEPTPPMTDVALDVGVMDMGDTESRYDAGDRGVPALSKLRVTELMAKNEGAWLDGAGEADDWIEIQNISDDFIDLSQYKLSDDLGAPHPLPRILLEPNEVRLLWADNAEEQGRFHLPFKLSSAGETLFLWHRESLIQEIVYPGLAANEVYTLDGSNGWSICSWASPGQPNPERCGPPDAPPVGINDIFEPYTWSSPWPFPPTPLIIAELSIHPPAFVEVLNSSAEPVDISLYQLQLSPHRPGAPLPARDGTGLIEWPNDLMTLEPGARVSVPIEQAALIPLTANEYEGVLSLWAEGRNFPIDRVDFMSWPEGAVLTRLPDHQGRLRFCTRATPGEPNSQCDPLPSRPVGERLRHLRTPGDFAALAEGDTAVGTNSVKLVIDLEGDSVTHLLSTARWDLHYTFVREKIEHLEHLDRCDPEESSLFREGWVAFSQVNYSRAEGRRFLLGTLTHYGSNGLKTMEFAGGDRAVAPQWKTAFFTAMSRVQQPQDYFIRPRTSEQVETLRDIEAEAPIVGRLTPFEGISYQALTQTVGFGVLRYVPVRELPTTPLGPQVIVITDEVPNDIELTGGLITEAFQTPLAHVNLLSRNRDTPNMALVDARNHPRVAPLLGQLVRLEVSGPDFDIRAASSEEAERFWESRRPDGPPLSPRLDITARGVTPLIDADIGDVGRLGAKAAQLAHLGRLATHTESCATQFHVPNPSMAIPTVHSLEHYSNSGAEAQLSALMDDPEFRTDPRLRAEALTEIRGLIEAHPVDPELLDGVTTYVSESFGATRVRFRSSSNTEDLPGFNGAGLYTSISAEFDNASRSIEDAIRTVWASLYLSRAYDERRYHNIDESQVAMGILVHSAFLSERANGVGISRNILQPTRRQSYLNVQLGEASVANPAPGITTDQIIHDTRYQPEITYLARSNLADGQSVLSDAEVKSVACVLRGIQAHFKPELDPDDEDPWFAMDIEFKLVGPERRLFVKQARPYSFGSAEVPSDCREL